MERLRNNRGLPVYLGQPADLKAAVERCREVLCGTFGTAEGERQLQGLRVRDALRMIAGHG